MARRSALEVHGETPNEFDVFVPCCPSVWDFDFAVKNVNSTGAWTGAVVSSIGGLRHYIINAVEVSGFYCNFEPCTVFDSVKGCLPVPESYK